MSACMRACLCAGVRAQIFHSDLGSSFAVLVSFLLLLFIEAMSCSLAFDYKGFGAFFEEACREFCSRPFWGSKKHKEALVRLRGVHVCVELSNKDNNDKAIASRHYKISCEKKTHSIELQQQFKFN